MTLDDRKDYLLNKHFYIAKYMSIPVNVSFKRKIIKKLKGLYERYTFKDC